MADRCEHRRAREQFTGLDVDLSHGLIEIDVARQTLTLHREDTGCRHFPVSTSRYGTGNGAGSRRTPLGLHFVDEKIGAGEAAGAVFLARKPTGENITGRQVPEQADLITSRILWLRGLEAGVNAGDRCDTHDRYIYIHGTPHTDRLGSPASIGCVRMADEHVIELFDQVVTRTPVLIAEQRAGASSA